MGRPRRPVRAHHLDLQRCRCGESGISPRSGQRPLQWTTRRRRRPEAPRHGRV